MVKSSRLEGDIPDEFAIKYQRATVYAADPAACTDRVDGYAAQLGPSLADAARRLVGRFRSGGDPKHR